MKEDRENFDTRLELLQHFGQVHTPQKDKITPDFVYAKLNEKDKEGTIEMTHNAEYTKRMINHMLQKAKRWIWIDQKQIWIKVEITNEQNNKIQKRKNDLYDSFMTRVYMTSILSRNVKDNHLLRLLLGEREEELGVEEDEHRTKLQRGFDILKGKATENRDKQ